MSDKPNCYKCTYRGRIPGDAHSKCNNADAKVKGHPGGIRGGWFHHPVNFDPTWLLECDGFQSEEPTPEEAPDNTP